MAELSFKLSTGLIDYPIVGFLGGEVFTGANLSNPHIPGRIKRFGKVLRCFAIPSRCLFGKQIYMVGWENMPGRVQAAQRYQITIILALDWRNRKKNPSCFRRPADPPSLFQLFHNYFDRRYLKQRSQFVAGRFFYSLPTILQSKLKLQQRGRRPTIFYLPYFYYQTK